MAGILGQQTAHQIIIGCCSPPFPQDSATKKSGQKKQYKQQDQMKPLQKSRISEWLQHPGGSQFVTPYTFCFFFLQLKALHSTCCVVNSRLFGYLNILPRCVAQDAFQG